MSELLFGYATLGDESYVGALLGRVPQSFPAFIEGFELCLQSYETIPPLVQNAVKNSGWNPQTFRSYFARRSSDPLSRIDGRVWSLNDGEGRVLDDWEFEGLWYQRERAEVTDMEGRRHPVVIYTIPNAKDKPVGEVKNPYPVDKELMLKLASQNNLVAREARGEK